MQNYFHKIGNLITGIMVAFLFMLQTAPASAQSNTRPANVSAADWKYSGRNGVVVYRLDGKILNMMHVDGRRFLRQGYDAKRDDKRNVEASPSDQSPTLPSRGLGYEWVLEYTGDGYYRIINLTTGLNLTWDGNDENVSNWGAMPSRVDHQKWRFVLSDRQQPIINDLAVDGSYGTFRIYNKAAGRPLTMHSFGKSSDEENVTLWTDPGPRAPGFDWVLMPGRDLQAEANVRANNVQKGGRLKSFYSDSLISVRRLTIEKVKAIKVSTGQDDATKALFTGIDVLIDAGLGVATGGASAAATTAVRVGGRALTKEVIKSAAKAGAKKAIKGVTKKGLVQDYAKGLVENQVQDYAKKQIAERQKITEKDVGEDVALEMASLGLDVLDAMSSESIFNEVYGESPDDFYIRVNGFSIFPHGGREHLDIESQQTLVVNKSFVFDRFNGATIQLVEYDSASDDDGLGSTSWFPYWDSEEGVWYEFGKISALKGGKGYMTAAEREALPTISLAGKNPLDGVERYEGVLISEDDEGSLYEITYRIEPFIPAFRSTGNMDAAKVKKRIQDWANRAATNAALDAKQKAFEAAQKRKAEAEQKAAYEAELKKMADDQDKMLVRLRRDRMVFADTNLENCALRGSVQSAPTGYVPTIIHNLGAGNVSVYAVDTNGGEGSLLMTLGADTYQTVNAPQGAWIVGTNSQGACVGLGMPSGPDNQMIFNSDKSAPPPTTDNSNQGYIDPATGQVDTNEYADDQSGLEDYPEDMSQYIDQSQLPGVQAGPGCEYLGQVNSQEGGNIVSVQFSNATNSAMDVYWIDGQGEANNYEGTGAPVVSVPAQSYQGVRTKIGHVFAAVDNFGNCLGVGQVETDAEDFRFEPLQ